MERRNHGGNRRNLPKVAALVSPQAAAKSVAAIESAFPDANVAGWENIARGFTDLPDPGDAHVIAAAIRTSATVIVSDNRKHFPDTVLSPLGLECLSADAFIADTLALDPGNGLQAIDRMLARHSKPPQDYEALLRAMEAAMLPRSVEEIIAALG